MRLVAMRLLAMRLMPFWQWLSVAVFNAFNAVASLHVLPSSALSFAMPSAIRWPLCGYALMR
jgi:hypothetical protein